MSTQKIKFALNHILAPKLDTSSFCSLATSVGIDAVELRNDIGQHSIKTASDAQVARQAADHQGIKILSINALQQFNHWTADRAEEAREMIEQVVICGGDYLVMCPVNLASYQIDAETGKQRLLESLENLKPLLDDAGIKGLIEPLGFPISSLRTKQAATDSVNTLNGWQTFGLLQDSFHHYLANEQQSFPNKTNLVHISGVNDDSTPREELQDSQRVMVGPDDVMDNAGQMSELLQAGYAGYFSFEPFARSVGESDDHESLIRQSIQFLDRKVAVTA